MHCRLTLLANTTRIDSRRSAPAHECCCPPCCDECGNDEKLALEYTPCADDPRIVRQYGAREAIATSAGRDNSGTFQLDFHDQRYLPFEYMGAVSRSSSASATRRGKAASRHLPGDGWRFFELRHDFPDAWQHRQ